MMLKRRTVLTGGGAAVLAAGTHPETATGAEAKTDLAAAIVDDGRKIKVVRVSAENGQTAITDAELPADPSPYPLFKQFLTHKASATAVYGAPPRHRIATDATDKFLVFIAAGNTTLMADSGARQCDAGSFILTDTGSRYTEHAGPEGYTAIKVRLAD